MANWNADPYDPGIPKYHTATDIYDALKELMHTEEMGILAEIGMDVSWEQQGYYYYDKGHKLMEEFETLSDYGNKLWLLDLAVLQIDQGEIHDTVYEALCNDGLAKRTGFKKIFVDTVLGGYSSLYKDVTEAWEDALAEEGSFYFQTMMISLSEALRGCGVTVTSPAYPQFCHQYHAKLMGLKLEREVRLIEAVRAHLTAYDDFLFGLRVNQALHEEQERYHQRRVALLEEQYQTALNQLLAVAQRRGLAAELAEDLKMLGGGAG